VVQARVLGFLKRAGGVLGVLDIVFFAVLAGFLAYQLHRVLGRRTGNERRRPDLFTSPRHEAQEQDNVISLPDRPTALDIEPVNTETLSGRLMQLKMADPSFDDREFARGARTAFEWIVSAFARGDTDTLRPLLSDDLYAGFASAIQARDDAGETLETTVSSIRSADIADVQLVDQVANVTVEFVSEQVKCVRDGNGVVVDGDPDRMETITDIWTFARDTRLNDPNWKLVATRTPED
jgi:predicted lipid-binding transport protein (Tim44 family)